MELSILIGLVIFLAVVGLFLVFIIRSAISPDDAHTVDPSPVPPKYDERNEH